MFNFFSSVNNRVFYDAKGSGDISLIFVHGWCGNRTFWEKQIQYFSERFAVYCLDLPGCGKSPPWPETSVLEACVRAICGLVSHIGARKAILISHSVADIICLEAAQRLPRIVKGIIGVEGFRNIRNSEDPEFFEKLASDFVSSPHVALLSYAERNFFHPETAEPFKQMILRSIGSERMDSIQSFGTLLFKSELEDAIQRLSIPIHIINSDLPQTNLASNRHPTGSLKLDILPGASHFVMLEEPNRLNAALERSLDEIVSVAESDDFAKAMPEERPIFIFAQARSGSTLLQRALNASPEALISGEHLGILHSIAEAYLNFIKHPDLLRHCSEFGTSFVRREAEFHLRRADVFCATINGLNKATVSNTFRDFVSTIGNPLRRQLRWGFKEIRYGVDGDRVHEFLLNLYPLAKIICLIRNPVDQIDSKLRRGWWGENLDENIQIWRMQALNFQKYAAENPDSTALVRYEDLINQESRTLSRLLKWLQIEQTVKHDAIVFQTDKLGATPAGGRIPLDVEQTIRERCLTAETSSLYR